MIPMLTRRQMLRNSAISLAALGMNLLGDGLRDVLDPRLRNL